MCSSLAECQRKRNPDTDGYSTCMNDIWSLGVILVNLVCGRNPWRQASSEDETFQAFIGNPGLLETILPISQGTAYILGCIFALNPRSRPDIQTLKGMVRQTTIFSRVNLENRHPPLGSVHRRDILSAPVDRTALQYTVALPTLPGLIPHQASCSSDDEMLVPITPYIASPFDHLAQDTHPYPYDTIYQPSPFLPSSYLKTRRESAPDYDKNKES
jgi:serine/threonine protein kinase